MAKILCICALAVLAACNTIEGVGHDVRSAGASISNTAAKAKHEISK